MTKEKELKLSKAQAKLKRTKARKHTAFEIFMTVMVITRIFFMYVSILWILFWSTAVDSHGQAGDKAISLVMLGVSVLVICFIWGEMEDWYER